MHRDRLDGKDLLLFVVDSLVKVSRHHSHIGEKLPSQKGGKDFYQWPPHPQKKYALTKMTKLPTKLGINSCGANVFTLRVMQSSVLPSLSSGQSRWPHRRSENPCSAGKPEQGWQKTYCKKKLKIWALWQAHQCLEDKGATVVLFYF